MRLSQVSLLRWGAFSDRTITLRPDAKLHLLYGRNEAGKTTMLRAVRDLLFQIERQSSYATRHGPNVRLGGTVVSSSGQTLSFRRRRSNSNSATLLDVDGKALPDDALAPFLGGVDRDMFQDLFGLDHERMRKGAEAMLQAEGELGTSLFAAAGGVRNLVRVRGALSAEADGLFTPRRAAGKRFYKALDAYEDAKQRERKSTLATDDWRTVEREQAEAAAHERALGEEFQAANRRRALLERLRRVAPLLRQLQRLRAEVSDLSDAPLLPADFRERVDGIRLAADKARAQRDAAAAERDRCLAERRAVIPEDAVLRDADAIEQATQGIGRYANGRTDIDKLERDLRRTDDDILALLATLGEPVPDLHAAGPGEPDEAGLRALAGDQRALIAARDQAQKNRARAELTCRQLRQQRDSLTPVERPAAERALLDRLRQLGPVDRTAATAERAAQAARRSVDEALSRLGLTGWTPEAAVALALPTTPTVESFGRRFEQSDQSVRDQAREHDRLAEAAARIADDLAELEAASPLPTPEAIAAARGHRDYGWRLVRDVFIDHRPNAAAPAAAYGQPLPDAFEAAVAEADLLADRRDAEADRLARHAQLSRDLARARQALATAAAKLDATKLERRGLEADWRKALPVVRPLSPEGEDVLAALTPSAMLDWLRRHNDLLRLVGDWRTAEAAALQAVQVRDEVGGQLGRLLTRLGEAPDACLADMTARGDGALMRREAAAERWTALQKELAQAEEQVLEAQSEEALFVSELAAWTLAWSQAVAHAGLPAEAQPVAVEAMLKIWADVRAKRRERHEAARRLDGLRQHVAGYEGAIAALALRLGADSARPPAEIVAGLQSRLTAARSARDKAADLDRRAEAQRQAEEQAAAQLVAAEAELAALLRLAGAACLDDLPERLRRAAARDEADRRLTAARQALADAAPGAAEEELAAAVAAEAKDDDALDAEVLELSEQLARLSDERRNTAVAASAAARRLEDLRGGASAADAAQDARNALAELRVVTEEWMRLRAAELLLARAIDTFRANAQDPMVRRAGDLFRRVTLGGYQGLAVDYGEGDAPVLVGVDAAGERCPVVMMSDGTRDQLYLALRIASVERYCERAEPMPFLADDLFINWDDHRTEEGIAVLAELGGSTQTLLLTHHLAIVDAARRRIPERDLEVISLERRFPSS